jgi:nuclear protein localization family protein 4
MRSVAGKSEIWDSGELSPLSVGSERSLWRRSHGDMLFMSYKPLDTPSSADPSASASAPSAPLPTTDALLPKQPDVKEDEVDTYWRARDGKIVRGRDATMCRHGGKGMCDYCMPVEVRCLLKLVCRIGADFLHCSSSSFPLLSFTLSPSIVHSPPPRSQPYDATYQATHQIKHLSFHAYLRKLTAGTSTNPASSASQLPPLTPLNYRVRVPCTSGGHAPWPAGICSKCQPSAITLQSQPFRAVDHVEFATPRMIESFLDGWRRTGKQRFGVLLGRARPYEKVPMGIRVVVEAIHEVSQEGEVDGLTLGEGVGEEEEIVKNVAGWCQRGLQVVGMVFTDLTP